MAKTRILKATRREFLRACAATAAIVSHGPSWALSSAASSAATPPIVRMETDPALPLVPILSWDTEGGDRLRTNLLRSPGLRLRIRPGAEWLEATELSATALPIPQGRKYSFQLPQDSAFHWEIFTANDGLTMSFSAQGAGVSRLGNIEVVVPFAPGVTPTTVVPHDWHDDGSFATPLIISAPDFGQMLLEVTPQNQLRGRLIGSHFPHTLDLFLELSPISMDQPLTISLKPILLEPPQGLEDPSMWRLARRGWFNAFQPGAAWGVEGEHLRVAIPGVLANNVLSDPASISQVFYADMMLWTPRAAGDIQVAQLVRRTVDYWLNKRTVSNHEAYGYDDFLNFLDANPNLLICAWDYVEATGDTAWLKRNITRLEGLADFLALRDQDQDGLVEATQSGNAGTLWVNNRSSNWFDAVNYGYKDAYANALIYRGWRCLADLESKLARVTQRARYSGLADKLKAAYSRELLNPQTGLIACWKSDDGRMHDYASPIVNGMAISHGLVASDQCRPILDRLWTKMKTAGFHRWDLGIPSTLEPVHRSDYLQPNGFGIPTREDGTDTFQYYQNGGIAAGHSLHFLLANYVAGYGDKADRVLRAMLERQQQGLFQNGVQGTYPNGGEWTTWEGKTSGYEGYLADTYYFLQAVVLREPAMRARYLRPMSNS
jgi:hypothetical protein